MNEKFITFPQNHQLLSKEELRGKIYYKYYNSWNHNTNACWSFKNVVQDRVNKGIVKFLGEKEAMVKFPGEKEVMVKLYRENEVMVKFPREKEVMVKYLGERKSW